MRAVLISDYVEETSVLSLVLQRAGFEISHLKNFEKAIRKWPERNHDQPVDLIMIAFSAGAQITPGAIETLRSQSLMPIVVVSEALPEWLEVSLLESGVDLKVSRPFSVLYLIAQIRTLMRRTAGMPFFSLPILSQSGIMVDPSNRTIQVEGGEEKRLTQLEFRLLFTLMTHAGRVIPSETLVEYVWGFSGEGNRGLVRGLVQRLRSKVESNPAEPKYILTEPGIGYRFNVVLDS